jgi:hypothetical protein
MKRQVMTAQGRSFWFPVRHRSVRLPEGPGLVRTFAIAGSTPFKNLQYGVGASAHLVLAAPAFDEPYHLIRIDRRRGTNPDQRQGTGDVRIRDLVRI